MNKAVKDFIVRYSRLIDRIVYNQLEAMVSWRNSLIVVTAIFCFKALSTGNPTIVTVVFGIWSLIVGWYFHLRQQTDKEGRAYKSRYDDELSNTQVDVKSIETPETFEVNE